MRIGMNPQKQDNKIVLKTNHRIIVVVYIPDFKGYYKNIFEVFKLCLESIIATKNDRCAVTVVNNASCLEVSEFIDANFKNGNIDCVIHHNENIGKIDAIIGAARGVREPLITMTDTDILFKNGWQENIEDIFMKIKDTGSVSPMSFRKSINYGTSSTLKKILLRKIKFRFLPIPENFDEHNKNLESINREKEVSKDSLWPVIEENGVKAIVGSGHQVLTIRREILFKTVPTSPCFVPVGLDSEFKYVDEPINKAGGLRLATYNNYAYHMGNAVEDWMFDVQQDNVKNKEKIKHNQMPFQLPKENFRIPNYWRFHFYQRLYIKIFNMLYKKIYRI